MTWTVLEMKPKNWRQTEQNGINVWPNASIRMWVKLRTQLKVTNIRHTQYGYSLSDIFDGLISSLLVRVQRNYASHPPRQSIATIAMCVFNYVQWISGFCPQ